MANKKKSKQLLHRACELTLGSEGSSGHRRASHAGLSQRPEGDVLVHGRRAQPPEHQDLVPKLLFAAARRRPELSTATTASIHTYVHTRVVVNRRRMAWKG